MQETENEDLMKYTHDKLSAHFQNNKEFNKQFSIMHQYYLAKFEKFIKEEDKEIFEKKFYQSVKSQLFNGYFIIRELLTHEDTKLPDDWLEQPESYITEEVPGLINDLAGVDVEEVITTEDMHDLTMWAVTRYEDVLPVLKQTAFDIVCIGASQALFDEREERGLEKFKSTLTGLMGNLDEYNFINPQLYLSANVIAGDSEIWNLSWWSSLAKTDNKAGELSVIAIPQEQKTQYALNLYLSNRISEPERKIILESCLFRFMDNKEVSREDILVQFAVVEDFYILVQE